VAGLSKRLQLPTRSQAARVRLLKAVLRFVPQPNGELLQGAGACSGSPVAGRLPEGLGRMAVRSSIPLDVKGDVEALLGGRCRQSVFLFETLPKHSCAAFRVNRADHP